MKRPTIRDVATAAGVSKSLVSLVFSDSSGVSADRRQRVLAAADALGYRPNWLARALAADDGNFVGILVADTHNPLFMEIVDAARIELAARGQYGLLTSAVLPPREGDPPRLDERILSAFGDLRPRSVLIVGSVPDMPVLSRLAYGVPIVVASAIAENLPMAVSVRSDDAVGMDLVIAHLVERGHRRIAHLGGQGGPVAAERASSYVEAMRRHGLADEICIEPAEFTESSGFRAADALLRSAHPPTAIAAMNDLTAIGAQTAIDERAAATSVALTGYDNTFLAANSRISLTSVNSDNAEIGRRAAHALDEPNAPGRQILVTPTLVVRASSTAASA